MLKSEYVLYCPGCGNIKGPNWVIGTKSYSVQTLDIPYFICSECRFVGIDKTVIRKALSSWKNDGFVSKNMPLYNKLYKEMLDIVSRAVSMYCRTAGYKRRKFRKIIHKLP